MFTLDSITDFFSTHGKLRKSQRTTLAALVWALIRQPRLGIAAIGRSLATAKTTKAKHTIKRVDRFLGNSRIDMAVAFGDLIDTVVGSARTVYLTLDWTDPKTKDQRFQILSIHVRAHGRALPIAWITVAKTDLKNQMRRYEEALCTQVADLLPATCHPILLADRGFATGQFFRFLDALGWDWIIRSKGNIWVQWNDRWTPLSLLGKARPLQLDGPVAYGKRAAGGAYPGRLVVYADTVHPDPWFLLVSAGLKIHPWGEIVAAYGQRFTCEEAYKDQKNDPGEGFHLDCVKLGSEARWDRLWLIFAWAFYWMNVAGWEAEVRGLDVQWRANTVKTRTHALWRLGHWALMDGTLFWRDLFRRQAHFRQNIPAVGTVPPPT
jgi:hypothetical protein